jgi:adenine-specific DNA-methyltransferase
MQKLRGGYYTPKPIADFLADWVIPEPTTTILEPSYGDGNLIIATSDVLLERGADRATLPSLVHGVEFDEQEAEKAAKRLEYLGVPPLDQLQTGDFFEYCRDQLLTQTRFDAIIGNPPFIRYQHFQEDQRKTAFQLMRHAGLTPNRLTNTWVPFLVASTLLLKDHGGRIGMVIPAELMQVNYAAELRKFLIDQYSKITLITFKKLVFEGIQQEVVLFLGERNGYDHTGIRTMELDGIDDLATYEHTHFSSDELKSMDHSREKWTQYFLNQDEIDLLRELRANDRITVTRDVIDVDVGVVTGLNEFFILTQEQCRNLDLGLYTQPIVTRSGHLPGIRFTLDAFLTNTDSQYPSRILDAPDVPFDKLPKELQRYIKKGEEEGVHTGYKCRIRKRWYIVPSVWTPDAFMLRQIHSYPKLILNKTRATCTDTIHRVRFVSDLPPKLVTAAFLNSLTFAFSEVIGRSYGGGVLELEPNEAETIPIPLNNADALDFDQIHALVVQGNIEAVLNITDQVLLVDGLGLSIRQVEKLRAIWYKLRDRRINRKHQRKAERVDAAV